MGKPITIRLGQERLTVTTGTRILDLFGTERTIREGIIGAVLNNHSVCLDTRLTGNAEVSPILTTQLEGQDVFRRSASHMLHYLMLSRYPHIRFSIGQSLFSGYYYEVHDDERGDHSIDLPALARDLTSGLRELAERDIPFHRKTVSIEESAEMLPDPSGSKAKLLRTWCLPTVPLVGLDGFQDIQHGPYAPSTGYIRGTRVDSYQPGLILQFDEKAPVPEKTKGRGLYRCYRESRDWNLRVGVPNVADLNAAVLEDRVGDVIHVSEALHEKKIAEIADDISSHGDRIRLVCVAGPSSSGKTTFVRRLSIQLRVNGVEPVILGLDDYYRNRDEMPLDESGEKDYEAIEALDLPTLHEHLKALLDGKEVLVPRFDFVLGKRTDSSRWHSLRLKSDQVLLIEGIHGINPRLTNSVPEDAKYRIFISALTQLSIDEHNRILTSDMRLLRRIVRDRRNRGYACAETIERWASVRRGEDRYIFPFQEQADVMFNSALVYETAILKVFAWRYLLEVPRSHPAHVKAYQLLKFLDLFIPIFPDDVPRTSILREFIGGGGFEH